MSARFLECLLVLACASGAACASSGAVPRPFPVPGEPSSRTAPLALPGGPAGGPGAAPQAGAANGVVGTALALRGVPYLNGGSDPSGFDCSGFVWYVFGHHGIAVPRTVAAQFQAGRPVPSGNLQPGDLVFFETGSGPASHVGVVVSGDEFVHAPSTRGEVRVEHLAAPYWSSRFVGARRLSQMADSK
jgi:cell wall-associated NlpC family hydrolase